MRLVGIEPGAGTLSLHRDMEDHRGEHLADALLLLRGGHHAPRWPCTAAVGTIGGRSVGSNRAHSCSSWRFCSSASNRSRRQCSIARDAIGYAPTAP